MASLGIRELRDNLSRYVRRAEQGERIQVTAHGRVIAEIGPPEARSPGNRLDDLVRRGLARPPLNRSPFPPTWGKGLSKLPHGTAKDWIDADREDLQLPGKRRAARRGRR